MPLVFSGRRGLIAQFVLGSAGRATNWWRLDPVQLHALARPEIEPRGRMIVFEQPDAPEFLALESVNGISRERTEMMFTFRPLSVCEPLPYPVVRRGPLDRMYTEQLVLEGGALAPDAAWHWRQQSLALGGVTCGAQVPVGCAS